MDLQDLAIGPMPTRQSMRYGLCQICTYIFYKFEQHLHLLDTIMVL